MKSRDRESDGLIRIDEARRTASVRPANENAAPLATFEKGDDAFDEFEIEFEPEGETRH